ncbi:sulfite exporter TauE/SafE family protein [Acidianus brierleyi]|uniref:Probable membrane transporter protein n=1 Tax=Acidianus brierleyi TaxID=41673 RepID=A0A2U9IB84_9CREN|nr:sulfite exporter TauE/SafE family protein [Acidianus brierleyi]AWR93278.1 TSUP family transporter [Acidianus brierleyi]
MIPIYILIIIGIAVGALTGITGSSGVLIVVPALSYLGLSFEQSIGSSLLVDVITTLSVVFVYFKHENVDLKISMILGIGAIVGAQIGSAIAFITPEEGLESVFTIFTAYMAYVSFKRSRNPKLNIKRMNLKTASYVVAPILSLLIGIVTGTLGASGGIMFIAVMMLLFSIDVKRMIGTATLAMLLSAISGATAYSFAGKVDMIASLTIGITALISGYFFARLANKMRPSTIYIFLGSVFVITSISELFRII